MGDRLLGKVAVVTGGASGLGAGIVRRFVEEGARVIVADLVDQPGKPYPTVVAWKRLDVRSEPEWERTLDDVVQTFGRLDILVNNAGVFSSAPVDSTALDEFQRVLDVNLVGVFLGCKHAVRHMKLTGGGSIINLSSVTGLRGQMGGAAYCASKGGVRMLSRAVALDGGPHQIRCNSIHPGIVESPMLRSAMRAGGNEPAAQRHIESYLPLGRIGDPALDVGNMALYLASDDSRYITGTEMIVDGGMITGLPR